MGGEGARDVPSPPLGRQLNVVVFAVGTSPDAIELCEVTQDRDGDGLRDVGTPNLDLQPGAVFVTSANQHGGGLP